MLVSGERNKRRIGIALAVSVGAALLAWVAWMFWPAADRRVVIVPGVAAARPVTADGVQLKPVDLPVALLFDCYENALENVPPRTDTSKRQWSWEAPPLPMDVARKELTKAGASENDRKVLAWLENWEEGWKKDYPTTTDALWSLEPSLKENTKLDFAALMRIGSAMAFLDSDEHAACWMVEAIQRAPQSTAHPDQLLDLLAATRPLWRTQNHAALESRFEIERHFNKVGSIPWRKSVYLLAEAKYYLGDVNAAKGYVAQARKYEKISGDSKSDDLSELNWLDGILCYNSKDYREALERLAPLSDDPRSIHRAPAMRMTIRCLAELGRIDESRSLFERWRAKFAPPLSETIDLVAAIQRNER